MKKHILTIIAYDQSHPAAHYQYLINKGGKLYKRFNTTNGYNNFIKRMNLKLEHVKTFNSPRRGSYQVYQAYGTIEEVTFHQVSDLPVDAINYLDIHDGCLVEHYYIHTDSGIVIYKPHIYSEAYQPYSLSVKNEYMQFNG